MINRHPISMGQMKCWGSQKFRVRCKTFQFLSIVKVKSLLKNQCICRKMNCSKMIIQISLLKMIKSLILNKNIKRNNHLGTKFTVQN